MTRRFCLGWGEHLGGRDEQAEHLTLAPLVRRQVTAGEHLLKGQQSLEQRLGTTCTRKREPKQSFAGVLLMVNI